RGCGRGCEFCEVTLRRPRYFPLNYIGDEIAINARDGQSSIQLHSDDIFLYKLENWKTMEPNEDAVKDLFRFVMDQPGVSHCYPTHGTVSAAVTNPGLIADLTEIVHGGPNKWIGIQSGIETGSPALSRAVLHRKAAPFTAEEWPDIVVQGTQILNRNYWYPAFTIILGLPGETPEDAWMTVDLIDRMEQIPDGHFITAPLTFVPIGVLRGEEFYNIDEMIDESRFNVAYRAWRHVLLEIDEDLWHLTRLPAPTRALVVATARIGGRYILGIMHRYARRMGFRIRAPAKTRRQAEGHTLSFPAGFSSAPVRNPGPILLRLRLGAFLSHDRREGPLSPEIDDLLEIAFRPAREISAEVAKPLAEHREGHVSPDSPHVGLDELVRRLCTHALTLRPASDGR